MILPKDKMIQVLLDIHLTESLFQAKKSANHKEALKLLSTEYEKIFKKHKITSEEFYSTFNYYLKHPAEMDSVYKDLVDVATQQQSEFQKSLQETYPPDSPAVKGRERIRNIFMKNKKR